MVHQAGPSKNNSDWRKGKEIIEEDLQVNKTWSPEMMIEHKQARRSAIGGGGTLAYGGLLGMGGGSEAGAAPKVLLQSKVRWPGLPPGFGPQRPIEKLPPRTPPGHQFLSTFQGPTSRSQSIPHAYYSFMLSFLNALIGIRCPSGTIYMVKVEMEDGQLMLKEGWSTLASCEQLQANQLGLFERIAPRHFDLVIFVPQEAVRVPLATPVGFNARNEEEVPWEQVRHILEGITELELTPEMRARVRNIWLGSADRFTIYIAMVTEGQISSGQMYFSRKFSRLLPDETMEVQMRFRGRDCITDGILKKDNHNTYIRGGAWSKFVAAHNVKANKIYIFKLSFAEGRATLTVSSALYD